MMNNENAFQTVTNDILIELIEGAKDRLVLVVPGVRKKVAEAIARAAERLNGKWAVNYARDQAMKGLINGCLPAAADAEYAEESREFF